MQQPQQHYVPVAMAPPVPGAAMSLPLGPEPCTVQCPQCHSTVTTRIDYKSNTKTHIIALLLCLFLCWPCVCVPYCTGTCRTKDHYCPACGRFLGSYSN